MNYRKVRECVLGAREGEQVHRGPEGPLQEPAAEGAGGAPTQVSKQTKNAPAYM